MFKSKASLLAIAFVLAVTPLLNSCGNEENASCYTTSKDGPSSSGYYLELTLCPSVVAENGTINLSARVWDGSGNVAAGVDVNFGGSTEAGAMVPTDQWGYAEFALITTGGAGTTGSITATVQDISVGAPYQILP